MAIVSPHPRSFLYVILMRRPRRAARLGEPVMRDSMAASGRLCKTL